MVTIVKVYFCAILYFVNFDVVISSDELYKKFFQNDYNITFERETVEYLNESYGRISVTSFKYNRTIFATNVTLFLNVDMGYDLEIILQAYKFLSNSYRPFAIHFEYNFCKSLKYDLSGVRTCAEQCGYVKCPLKKHIEYYVCNCGIDESKFPPLIPSGRYKLELEYRYKNDIVCRTEMYVAIRRNIAPGQHSGRFKMF